MIYQIIQTTNDRNGNPRRLTLVYGGHGEVYASLLVRVIEHGFSGDHIPSGAFQLPTLDVTGSEYASTKRFAKACSYCVFDSN